MPSSSKSGRPKRSSTSSSAVSNTSRALEKTEITINVYDLLPPGKLSSLLWTVGGSLLHSGVVIRNKEYAYGGHQTKGRTGVYWTRPKLEPPGGTWRCDVLQGFTFRTEKEIDAVIKEVSDEFPGPKYNLLNMNCNHFTNALCERLTNKPAPTWLNRAASIGLALPCVVPSEWASPPDYDTADGELLAEEDESSEEAAILASEQRRRERNSRPHEGTPPPRLVAVKDTSGRDMPVAERAPVPVFRRA